METRASRSDAQTTRRYKCMDCETSFFTVETFSKVSSKAAISDKDRADAFARLSIQNRPK
jgi:transcriptional regulator NrdR family protein